MAEPSPGATASPGLRRQREIYEWGLAGQKPPQPVSVEALEQKAEQTISREAFDYLAGGAGSEDTMRANREAFRKYRILPRVLRDVGRRDLGVDVLGVRLPAPFLLAPIGVQSILHNDAELAVARAARQHGIPMVLSSVSSVSMEEVAGALETTPRWFQLYWPKNEELAASLIQRAERAGFGALVVTLDTFLLSWRERDVQNAYLPFLLGKGLANYITDPVFHKVIGGTPELHPIRTIEYFTDVFSDPSRSWDDLEGLRRQTKIPILLKGILHPDDARRALDHGIDGLIVSNHGGRQIDGAIAALDALVGVVDAVGDRTTVLFDSGIRRGADVFKAVALGAKAVLLGRPYCFGLAVNGERGVHDVIANLIADIDLTLGLAGCSSFAELGRGNLVGMMND